MTRYLAGRNEMGGHESRWQGEKVLADLNQVILSHHPTSPASQVGIRNQSELTTLAMAIDYMLEGDYVKTLDLLIQRFKAVEVSLGENGWHMAKHLELIPPSMARRISRQRPSYGTGSLRRRWQRRRRSNREMAARRREATGA